MRDTDLQDLQVPWMADLIEINDPRALESYRLAWNALLPETHRASLFHSFDWLQTYWRYFGESQRLRVMVVTSDGRPIGFVPLCVRNEEYHVGSVQVLTYPLSDWGNWYGPIGPNPSACLFMAMKHLRSSPRDWDMLDLRWCSSDPALSDPTGRALRANGWNCDRSDYQQTSVIQLEGTDWESYRSQLNKKWRHELVRQQRVLRREFQVEVERHRPLGVRHGDIEPRWDLFDNCVQIAEHSWQGKSTTGNTLSHTSVRDFLQASHEVAARQGMLDMLVLKLNGEPAAFQYNYLFDGQLFGLRMGFERKFASYGVGKSLLGWMIEDSFTRGDRSIDMGVGDYDFKRKFRTGTETSLRYTYYPWTALRGQGVRWSQWLKSRWQTAEPRVAAKN